MHKKDWNKSQAFKYFNTLEYWHMYKQQHVWCVTQFYLHFLLLLFLFQNAASVCDYVAKTILESHHNCNQRSFTFSTVQVKIFWQIRVIWCKCDTGELVCIQACVILSDKWPEKASPSAFSIHSLIVWCPHGFLFCFYLLMHSSTIWFDYVYFVPLPHFVFDSFSITFTWHVFQGTASIHGIIKVGGGITLSFSLSDLVNFYHLL